MTRIFLITQPNVISLITMIPDQAEIYVEAMLQGRVALLLRAGPGWALYRPHEQTKETRHEDQADPRSGGDGIDTRD